MTGLKTSYYAMTNQKKKMSSCRAGRRLSIEVKTMSYYNENPGKGSIPPPPPPLFPSLVALWRYDFACTSKCQAPLESVAFLCYEAVQ